MNRANDIFEDVSNIDLIDFSLNDVIFKLNGHDISFPKTNNRNIISHYYFEIQETLLQHQ